MFRPPAPPQASRKRQHEAIASDSTNSSDSTTFRAPAPPKRPRGDAASASSSAAGRSDPLAEQRAELQRVMLSLEKNINRNLQDRMKFAEQPERFVDSEVDLDNDIKKLQQILPALPQLYADALKLKAVDTFTGLLSHENIDIVGDTIVLLSEIIDPEAVQEHESVPVLFDALIEKQVIETVVQVLVSERFDESDEDQSNAVHNCLSILENMADYRPEVCAIIARKTRLIDWMLQYVDDHSRLTTIEQRLQQHEQCKEQSGVLDTDGQIGELTTFEEEQLRAQLRALLSGIAARENKLYVAEVLHIFLQISEDVRRQMSQEQRIDKLLTSLAYFMRVTPKAMEDLEVVENLFDCLCTCLLLKENQDSMRESDGIELMLLFARDKKFARLSAVKCIDFALMNNSDNTDRFVTAGGLKTLFALLVAGFGSRDADKSRRKKKNASKDEEDAFQEHIISILSSLIKRVDGSQLQADISRLLSKFLEKDLDKTKHLLKSFDKYYDRVRGFDNKVIDGELQHLLDDEEELYLQRLDAGLFVLQQICAILGFLSVNSKEIHELVQRHLGARDVQMEEMIVFLQELVQNTEAPDEKARIDRIVSSLQVQHQQ